MTKNIDSYAVPRAIQTTAVSKDIDFAAKAAQGAANAIQAAAQTKDNRLLGAIPKTKITEDQPMDVGEVT